MPGATLRTGSDIRRSGQSLVPGYGFFVSVRTGVLGVDLFMVGMRTISQFAGRGPCEENALPRVKRSGVIVWISPLKVEHLPQ